MTKDVEIKSKVEYKFKVYNLDKKKYELGAFFIDDEEGDLYTQIIDWSNIVIEKADFNYRIEWEKNK